MIARAITGAYSTSSIKALAELVNISVGINNFENNPKISKAFQDLVRCRTTESWQKRWDNCEVGRLTHEFFPSIIDRVATGDDEF